MAWARSKRGKLEFSSVRPVRYLAGCVSASNWICAKKIRAESNFPVRIPMFCLSSVALSAVSTEIWLLSDISVWDRSEGLTDSPIQYWIYCSTNRLNRLGQGSPSINNGFTTGNKYEFMIANIIIKIPESESASSWNKVSEFFVRWGKYYNLVYSEAFLFFCIDIWVGNSNTAFHTDETHTIWALHLLQQAPRFPSVWIRQLRVTP